MLRNSLIRSAMTYGLHAAEIPHSQMERMETYMYKHIRTMMNPKWKEENGTREKALYAKIHQPTIASWIDKTQVMTMLAQTREQRTIRPKKCNEMILPKKKLQDQWENRHIAIMEKHRCSQRRKNAGRKTRNLQKRTKHTSCS